jgi:hypothetical protein
MSLDVFADLFDDDLRMMAMLAASHDQLLPRSAERSRAEQVGSTRRRR